MKAWKFYYLQAKTGMVLGYSFVHGSYEVMAEDLTPKVIEILAQLVAFDTTSSKPNAACIEWIQNYLLRQGVTSQIIPGSEAGKSSLFATIGTSNNGGIVLAGHSDVVPADPEKWTVGNDPFKLTQVDEKLYGRGTCDMKGFIACALALVPELVQAAKAGQLAKSVHLAFTHDEETDMSGAVNLSSYMQRQGVTPDWIWIGEPTSHDIVIAHKGYVEEKMTITGVPCHSSLPAEGLSAAELSHAVVGEVMFANAELRAKPVADSVHVPPYSTINIGSIKAGTPGVNNVVVDECDIELSTRLHSGDSYGLIRDRLVARIHEQLEPKFKSFRDRHPLVGFKTCTCFSTPPFAAIAGNPGVGAIAAHTGAKRGKTVSFATEAGIFQQGVRNDDPTHVVVCGPGSINVAHTDHEHVPISELDRCVDLMRSVLLRSPAL